MRILSDWTKIGVEKIDDKSVLAGYYLPEILIIICILGNFIKDNLIGLYDKSENEVETSLEAIYRNLSYDPKK